MSVVELILIATAAMPLISCRSIGGQYYVTPNDTQTCVNDLVEWCDGVKFPTEGIAMVTVVMRDSTGVCRATCTADSQGTNCTKNGDPWLTCTPQNQLLYKGSPLAKDSLDNSDNATCETADKAFNDLFIQNLSSDNTTLSKELESGLEQFFRAIRTMEERISAMQREFSNVFGGFGGGRFPFYNTYPNTNPYVPNRSDVPEISDGSSSSEEDSREKE